SLPLFAAVGSGHLLARPKDGRWLRILTAALVSLALFALTTLSLRTGSTPNTVNDPATFGQIIGAWLAIVSNGSTVLLAIIALGWLGLRGEYIPKLRLLLLMLVVYTALIGTSFSLFALSEGRVRYFLPGLMLGIVALAGGIYGWYRLRRLLGLLLVGAWLLAGWQFQQSADLEHFLGSRIRAYHAPPWHIISREARMTSPTPAILAVKPVNKILNNGQQIKFSMSHYYFAQHGIQVRQVLDDDYLQDIAKDLALSAPLVWLVTQGGTLGDAEAASMNRLLRDSGYAPCSEKRFIAETMLTTWTWQDLQCAAPQLVASYGNSLLTYDDYSASLDERGDQLRLRYRWIPAQHETQGWRISHQLLDDQWANVVQLDLPLDHADELRQYTIDLASLPAGGYRLMAVVYNAQTGERQAWHGNEGWIPEMRQLAEFTLSGTNQ
ncbi:MAG: hypothetical protein OXE95_11220, partial [Chloroflexi bacterium]|nr:hypothetical protein [Chloroflexota bacterium]